MIQSKSNVKKAFLLEGQVLFYSISILMVFLLMGREVSANDIVKAIFPNITDMYWFFSSYFVLYLFYELFFMRDILVAS